MTELLTAGPVGEGQDSGVDPWQADRVHRSPNAGMSLAFAFLGLMLTVGVCLAFLTPDQNLVAMPALTVLAIGLLFILTLAELDSEVPIGEIGAFFVAAVTLYAVFPLVGYLLRDMSFTRQNDPRLYYYQPGPQEMGLQGWRYVAYLLPCAAAYLMARGRTPLRADPLEAPEPGVFKAALVTTAALQILLFVYSLFYGVDAASYAEKAQATAAMASQVPLGLLQVASHMGLAMITLKMLIMVILFEDYRKYRAAIWIWLLAEAVLSVLQLGARSPLIFVILSAVFLYHRQVRQIRFWPAAAMIAAALFGYQLFGLVRSFGTSSIAGFNLLTGPGEFESHFATGFDIVRRRNVGSLPPVPLQLYFGDFLALIPSQILPFQKWTGAVWYLDILNVRSTGYGLTFGAIAESAIGFGWFDLVLRGAVLGSVFGWMCRWYARRGASFWVTALYLYLAVNCYNSFRSSSFYWIATLWLQVLPAYWFVRLFRHRRAAGSMLG